MKQTFNLCLGKFTLSHFKRKIWTWTGIQTSERSGDPSFRIPVQVQIFSLEIWWSYLAICPVCCKWTMLLIRYFVLQLLAKDPDSFKALVQSSLVRQVSAINALADKGMFFWDYGNAFLLEARRAGADVGVKDDTTGLKFRYPSYVQDIMGWVFAHLTKVTGKTITEKYGSTYAKINLLFYLPKFLLSPGFNTHKTRWKYVRVSRDG